MSHIKKELRYLPEQYMVTDLTSTGGSISVEDRTETLRGIWWIGDFTLVNGQLSLTEFTANGDYPDFDSASKVYSLSTGKASRKKRTTREEMRIIFINYLLVKREQLLIEKAMERAKRRDIRQKAKLQAARELVEAANREDLRVRSW